VHRAERCPEFAVLDLLYLPAVRREM
jgi:hypothetical protein